MIPDVQLSKREIEVAELVLQGKSNKQIASSLAISVRTVEFHLKNIYNKFHVGSRIELVLKLGNIQSNTLIENLWSTTVDKRGENTENRGRLNPPKVWMPSIRNAVSIIGKELKMKLLMKKPSAFLPMAMSLTALATVMIHIALFGVARQADEGAAAHIWQILMAAQIPIMAFFAIRWLPQTTRQALLVLTLQVGAALSALAPVFFLRL